MRKPEVDLKELEEKSIFIIREAKARFKNPAVMWSTGKDSTCMLALIRRAFYEGVPFPVVHLDTSFKFEEIYEFRNRLAKEWNLDLIVGKNEEVLKRGMSPRTASKFDCCMALKTEALKQVLREHEFDALIMSIRRDEHAMRNIERYFSPRDKEFKWHIVRPKTKEEMKTGDAPFISEQEVELWDLYQTDFGSDCSHVRVHPILHWTELDVWRFLKQEGIPVNPLYFSVGGERYRSLGCMPCTNSTKSDAMTIDEIIDELKTTDTEERAGRAQDKEDGEVFRRLRALGYM